MPAGDFPYGYGMFPEFNPVSITEHWPNNTVPAVKFGAPTPTGWKCPGCSRCFAPNVTECAYCGPGKAANVLPTILPGTTLAPQVKQVGPNTVWIGDPPAADGLVAVDGDVMVYHPLNGALPVMDVLPAEWRLSGTSRRGSDDDAKLCG